MDVTLIAVDGKNNHNKFYRVRLEGNDVVTTYGRVGTDGRTNRQYGGMSAAKRIINAKKRKGYREVDLIESNRPSTAVDPSQAISALTLPGTIPDDRVSDLVKYLSERNAHHITESTGGRITVDSSGARTALGVISADSISTARNLLDRIAAAKKGSREGLINEYLSIVPQKVPMKRGWAEHLYSDPKDLAAQYDLLDAISSSLAMATTRDDDDDVEPLKFRYTLDHRPDLINDMQKHYRDTISRSHSSSLLSAKVSGVYSLDDGSEALTGKTKRLWHGSRASNILSILSTGLRKPRPGDRHVTGAMFGPGIYLSDTSTKSAAYSRGGLWSSGVDGRWLMFLADVATGHEYRPNIHGMNPSWSDIHEGTITDTRKGNRRFDSVNVKAGTCGVYHHEAVVWNTDRIRLRYLIEFSS